MIEKGDQNRGQDPQEEKIKSIEGDLDPEPEEALLKIGQGSIKEEEDLVQVLQPQEVNQSQEVDQNLIEEGDTSSYEGKYNYIVCRLSNKKMRNKGL